MNDNYLGKLLWETSKVFAPSFPRQSADGRTVQSRRGDRGSFIAALQAATENGMPGYYSVYSFPRGHSKQDNVPDVDCIFIDLDITKDHYDPKDGRTTFEAWRADMSALLARARMLARAIRDQDRQDNFRAALSGHKGVHLYLDFPTIDPANGSIDQFKHGLHSYGQNLMKWLDYLCGGLSIERWVDVDGSDLGRLARHPNTKHHEVAYTDDERWCVPVTIAELTTLDVDGYIEYTSAPRPLPDGYRRVESQRAHDKVVQAIRTSPDTSGGNGNGVRRTESKTQALESYRDQQNDDITLDDVLFLTSNKPCFKAFRERDDAYKHGDASRTMELSIMGRLLNQDVPVSVIHQFFEPIPGFDENYTDDLLADLLSRGNEYGEFRCSTICGGVDDTGAEVAGRAPQFCLGSKCDIYRRSEDLRLPR